MEKNNVKRYRPIFFSNIYISCAGFTYKIKILNQFETIKNSVPSNVICKLTATLPLSHFRASSPFFKAYIYESKTNLAKSGKSGFFSCENVAHVAQS